MLFKKCNNYFFSQIYSLRQESWWDFGGKWQNAQGSADQMVWEDSDPRPADKAWVGGGLLGGAKSGPPIYRK